MRLPLRRPMVHVAFTSLVVGVATVLAPAQPASAAVSSPKLTGWIPYWSAQAATASVTGNRDLFDSALPFWHSATGAGSIADQLPAANQAATVQALHAAGIRVIPTVTDGTGAGAMTAVMANPAARHAHVATLVNLAVSRGYDGLDLNYEGFAFRDGPASWAATSPRWVTFVRELAHALHVRGKTLSVTIPPTYDGRRAGGSGYWVYDYPAMARAADAVRIEAYDYSVSRPGPIAPLAWVEKIAAYAVTQIPAAKLWIGVPAYGRDWVAGATGTCPTTADLATHGINAPGGSIDAANHGVVPTWDPVTGEKTFSYNVVAAGVTAAGVKTACTVTRTAWFVDAPGIAARARIAAKYGLAGLSVWSLGGEDAATFPAVRAAWASLSPTATASLSATSVARRTSATLSGQVTPARAGVVVYRQRLEGSTWRTVAMTRTNANGAFSFPLRSGSKVRTWTLRVVAKGGPPSAPVVLTVHG